MKNVENKKTNRNDFLSVNSKLHKLIFAGTIVYAVLVLYFMFLGFHRMDQNADYNQYTFILVPERILLRFPQLTMSWLYDFGNIAAFIPFGIIIPLLYRIRFRKFISLFIFVISLLEVIQSITFLGTFDIMDIISNTLGASIGFVAYKVGFATEITLKKLATSVASIFALFIVVMTVSEIINYGIHVNERLGPVIAISEISKIAPVTEEIMPFAVQGEQINPTLNLLSSKDGTSREYLFHVGKEDPWIYANCGIPDGEEYKGSVMIMVNGEELFLFSDKDEDKHAQKVKSFYNAKLEELKIIVTGNAKVWDVGIAEIKHWWQ